MGGTLLESAAWDETSSTLTLRAEVVPGTVLAPTSASSCPTESTPAASTRAIRTRTWDRRSFTRAC